MDKLIRLMVYIPDYWPKYTGHGIHLQRRLPLLRNFGIDPWILTRWYPGLAHDEIINGIIIRRFGINGSSKVKRGLRELILAFALIGYRKQYDIALLAAMHIAGITGGPLIKWIARRPVIREMTLIGSDDPLVFKKIWGGKILESLYQVADAFIAISQILAKSYCTANWPKEKLKQIVLGVDLGEFKPSIDMQEKFRIRSEFGLPQKDFLIWATIGSVIPRKGIHRLITAWENVYKLIPNAHLAIAGPQPDKDYLKAVQNQIEKAGISNQIHFLGKIDNAAKFLRCADGFAFASEAEGLGNALLEAMASGLPAVVQDISGLMSVILKNESMGIVVPPFDNESLANAIIMLCKDSKKCMALGQAARAEIEANYSLQQEVAAHAALYREIFLKYTGQIKSEKDDK